MFKIDKVLTIHVGPFKKSVDTIILTKVEELVHARVFYVDYRELPCKDKNYRKFNIRRAFNERDK